jgi:hypothetical protein
MAAFVPYASEQIEMFTVNSKSEGTLTRKAFVLLPILPTNFEG